MTTGFLPVTRQEMEQRGITQPDFVYVSGDAYVDHPSFGHAIISRVLEAHAIRLESSSAGLEGPGKHHGPGRAELGF